MKWKLYAFWSGIFFLPFMVLGEGVIGLIVIGVFGILNALAERSKKIKSNGFREWKRYRKDTLEEMR
jgi:hypothetical protein